MNPLDVLEHIQGRNTELVSLILPSGYDIREAVTLLRDEQAEARNIKDKNTRQNVLDALKRAEHKLCELERLPDNGVAVYTGVVPKERDKTKLEAWVVEPDAPLNEKLYRCDNRFHVDPVKNVHGSTAVYGVIAIDRSQAGIGTLRNDAVTVESTVDADIPSKHKKGGFSQQRFEQLRENTTQTYLATVADRVQDRFLEQVRKDGCLGLVVAGPGQLKDQLIDNHLQGELREAVVSRVDTSYAGEEGLREAVTKAGDHLPDAEYIRIQRYLITFFENLAEDNGLSVYGRELVETAIEYGAVDTLLVTDGECV